MNADGPRGGTHCMKILLVSPQTPDTFWSFRHVVRMVSKRAAFPPLGLLTVAAMLPSDWSLRVVDLNVERLRDEHLRRQAAAKIAQEELAFLIDRLGFIPGSTRGLIHPKKRVPGGRSHGGRRRPAARSIAL